MLISWHVEKNSLVVHSQLISCAASEVAAMIKGAMRHGISMAPEGNDVDSHGQSEIGFAITRLLDSICCRGSSRSTRPSSTGPTTANPTRIPA